MIRSDLLQTHYLIPLKSKLAEKVCRKTEVHVKEITGKETFGGRLRVVKKVFLL